MDKRMTMQVTDNTINGKCSNCGECCTSFLPMTRKEYETIKQYLKEHPEITNERHYDGENLHVLCAFRDEVNKRCKIYEVRPAICRSFLCSKLPHILEMEKTNHMKKAFVNKGFTNIISTQRLFFDDVAWEQYVLYHSIGADSWETCVEVLNMMPVKDKEKLLVMKEMEVHE